MRGQKLIRLAFFLSIFMVAPLDVAADPQLLVAENISTLDTAANTWPTITISRSESEMSNFVVGVAVGSLLLCLGIILGNWMGRRTGGTSSPSENDFQKLTQMFGGVLQLTNGVKQEVATYQSIVDQVTNRVGEEAKDRPMPGAASAMLDKLQSANRQLQEKLSQAESALRERADEAAAFMAEARTDALTGLANRRAFDDELSRRMAEWRRHGKTISVLLVDVDHFKLFNDHYGHLAGDAVLRGISKALRNSVRDTDLVTRYGGEEFAVLMPGGDAPMATQCAERIRLSVCDTKVRHGNEMLSVTISCGAAQAIYGEDMNALIDRADQALYRSKECGRNQAHWHDGEQCVCVTIPKAEKQTQAKPARVALAPDFDDVCSNLRQQLLKITDKPQL